MDLNDVIKDVISRVNSTLSIYEAEWISCKRTPTSEREVCKSFEQFIEIRFNYECSKVPELQKILEDTGGHLFFCKSLEDVDLEKKRFTLAHLELLSPDDFVDESGIILKELEEVRNFLGGSKISFNNVKKKIKFTIE